MSRAAADLRQLAQRIVALETKRGANGTAAFIVFERLRDPLAVLMGAGGFRSILSRALAVSTGESIWLRAIHVKANGSLEGLKETEAQIPPDQFIEGSVVLLESMLRLLVAFIGENLTFGIVADIWPKVSLENLGEERKNEKGK